MQKKKKQLSNEQKRKQIKKAELDLERNFQIRIFN